jgi:hypothetical protein
MPGLSMKIKQERPEAGMIYSPWNVKHYKSRFMARKLERRIDDPSIEVIKPQEEMVEEAYKVKAVVLVLTR